MVVLRTQSLVPPKELIKSQDLAIVVSSKRPVCVYYDKAIDLASQRIISAPTGSIVDLKITGAGGAIARCEQVARYTIQTIKDRFRHMIQSIDKTVTLGETEVTDLVIPDGLPPDLAALDMSANKRPVRTVVITIRAVIS